MSLPVAVLVVVLVGGEGAVVGAVPLVVGPMPIDVVVAVALPVAVSGCVDTSVGAAGDAQVHSDARRARGCGGTGRHGFSDRNYPLRFA